MTATHIEEKIIALLSSGPRKSPDLVAIIATELQVTIQTVYGALRKMKSEGIVLAQKKILTLNTVWIEEQVNLLERIQVAYLKEHQPDTFAFGDMENGDRISYQFKNPVLLDQMWGHIFLVLVERAVPKMPIMIYMSHNWFPIVRADSEQTIFKWLEEKGHRAYFSIGSDSSLDRDVTKLFLANMSHSFSLQVDLGMKKNKYLNVIGDYVIDVTLDEAVSAAIEQYFMNHQLVKEVNVDAFQSLVTKKGINKLVIVKNKKRAQKLRTTLAKHYLIPEESRVYI